MQAQRTPLAQRNALSRRSSVRVNALFGKKKSNVTVVDKEDIPKESMMTQTLNAFDFSVPRSKADAKLLYDAKQGKVGADGKLTPEQYAALRRKITGTAKDYWKDWVEDEAEKNIKTYTNTNNAGGTVPYLPFLIGVVVAMLVATVAVVAQTSS